MVGKIKIATGLTLTSSEQFQIANYGIGGYYDLHFDFATVFDWFKKEAEIGFNKKVLDPNGKRLATFMLYVFYYIKDVGCSDWRENCI